MANNAAGTVLALAVVGGIAYAFRDQIKSVFSSQSGDFVHIPGSNAALYVGTPTDVFAPQFGTQDLTNLFNHGQNPAPQSSSNPFRKVAGTDLTTDEILNLPVL